MKANPSSEHRQPDQELSQHLKDLRSFKQKYPTELLKSRRADFLTQLDALDSAQVSEELTAEEQEVANIIGQLKLVPVEYPAELLAARRSAFLRQVQTMGRTSILDRLRDSLQQRFPFQPDSRRISLVVGSLIVAVLAGALFLSRTEEAFSPVARGTYAVPARTAEVALILCGPHDQASPCPSAELTYQDLADPENGPAQPAVAKDAQFSQGGVHQAAHVNDGRRGASWVSNSPDSWIKIDLGQITTINMVSLQKGYLASASETDPGQFAIAVALSDVYADGDSSNDELEYTQVFHSGETSFSGTASSTEIIQTQFPPTRARFVKITFEQVGATIDEVGVFMAEPPVFVAQATRTPQENLPGATLTPLSTNTALVMEAGTPAPTGTSLWLPTNAAVAIATNTSLPAASNTPRPLPTDTQMSFSTPTSPPAPTSLPTQQSASDTPIPTVAPPTAIPPTSIPPTAIPPTSQPPPSADPIAVRGNDQTATFTCNGNAAEIRGHANTITLLGSCSSITVTGNGNQVFWESGSPVITDRGNDNVIRQL